MCGPMGLRGTQVMHLVLDPWVDVAFNVLIAYSKPFWATVCKTVRPMLSDRCLSRPVCPVRDVGVLWPNDWTDQDETSYAGRPRPTPHCIKGEPSFPPLKGHSPQFLSHICCGQMARWIKMPLGTDVGLDPSDIVLDGDPAPSDPHNSRPCLLWPDGCINRDATWCEGRHRPMSHCARWGPSSPFSKRAHSRQSTPPNFRPVSIVPKRLGGSRCHLVQR